MIVCHVFLAGHRSREMALNASRVNRVASYTISLLTELWNLDLTRSYKDVAPHGAGIFARSRGCRKLRQERDLCVETVLAT